MKRLKILGIIMAGGKGERLDPLTRERTKPAVSFAGKYRIVDFVLSNFVNSGIFSLYILVQYKSQSLIEHLRMGWRTGGLLNDQFITVVPPQMRVGEVWYRGTADAVCQNINLIQDFAPDLVAVFGADHVYRMDISQMVEFHLQKGADVTVSALPVPIEKAGDFGVIEVDEHDRVVHFQEKPKRPKPIPGEPSRVYASMGNYLFHRDILAQTLLEDARRSTDHDFGRTIIPELFPQARVFAYNFLKNELPGLKPYEERGYWRDVGTIEAYWLAHMDLLGDRPVFDLDNPDWPILTGRYNGPPAKVVKGKVEDSILGEGSLIKGATVRRSILGRGVRVEVGCMIEDSIVMDFTRVGKGTRIRRTIIDRYNSIDPGLEVGFDPKEDEKRFHVDSSGIVVIPRGGRGELWDFEEPERTP